MKRAALVAAAFFVLTLLWIGGCAVAEVALYTTGDRVPFTGLWRTIWAREPWVILLASNVLTAIVAFLGGHFFAAGAETYDGLRAVHAHDAPGPASVTTTAGGETQWLPAPPKTLPPPPPRKR